MASVKIIKRSDKKNQEGKIPLYLRIIQNRKATFISLGIYLDPRDWDDKTKRIRKSHPHSARMNAFLSKKVAEAEAQAVDIETNPYRKTGKRIKEEILGKDPVDFFQFADSYILPLERAGKIGTYKRAKAIVNKIKIYQNGSPLFLHDMDSEYLRKYIDYLQGTLHNKLNTVTSNLKIIRRILTMAVSQKKLDRKDLPFYDIKLSSEPSKREYLTDGELLRLEGLKLKTITRLALVRDMYVFAAYAGGIRISDLLKLKWNNYNDGRISYIIGKTNRELNIKIPNKAMEILNKYRTLKSQPAGYVFPFLQNNRRYADPGKFFNAISSAETLVNAALKELAKKAKITKKLSFHTSRHTFATRLLRKGGRIEYVSKTMGHANIRETQIYARIVNEDVDKTMDILND
jgi:integrase/recombinase XerD